MFYCILILNFNLNLIFNHCRIIEKKKHFIQKEPVPIPIKVKEKVHKKVKVKEPVPIPVPVEEPIYIKQSYKESYNDHKDHYDPYDALGHGYDDHGYDHHGYDHHGYDHHGYDHHGYDHHGHDDHYDSHYDHHTSYDDDYGHSYGKGNGPESYKSSASKPRGTYKGAASDGKFADNDKVSTALSSTTKEPKNKRKKPKESALARVKAIAKDNFAKAFKDFNVKAIGTGRDRNKDEQDEDNNDAEYR